MHAEPSFTKCLPGDHDWLTAGRETVDRSNARMRIRPAVTSVALLAFVTALLVAAALPAPAAAAKPCWERVINDWLDNGTIDQTYKPSCYQQALKHVPEDLRDYSNITDAISAALNNALRGTKPGGTTGSGTTGTGSGNTNSGGVTTPAGNKRHLLASPGRSPYRRALDNLGTTSADSLPIPLLVLAGLGTALLLTAAGLATRKRLRARPQPPAPGA
jgi:hypothetical protein